MFENVAVTRALLKRSIALRTWIALLVILTAGAQLACGRSQGSNTASQLGVGDSAPAINLDHVIDGSSNRTAKWSDLTGKVVIIEFWATWCEPCVEAIPHLNALADRFRNERIQFISVTPEDRDTVQNFLTTHPMKGWVALDPSATETYNAGTIPKTVVVDTRGRIIAFTRPEDVTEERLNRSLKGESVSFPPWTSGYVPPGEEPGLATKPYSDLFRVEIQRSGPGNEQITMARDGSKLTAAGVSVPYLIGIAFDVKQDRIIHPELLPEGPYTVLAKMPEGHADLLRPMLQQAMKVSFGVNLRRAQQTMDSLLLETLPGAALKPSQQPISNQSTHPGHMLASAISMSDLCEYLESELGKPVLDRSRLKETYDIELKYTEGNAESVKSSLKKIGLTLVPSRQKIDVLVVEKASGGEKRPMPSDPQ